MSITRIISNDIANKITIGKRNTSIGISMSGINFYSRNAEIFIECTGNKKHCNDNIAILPTNIDKNTIINAITDEQAIQIFTKHGWKIVGVDNSNHTRCPVCQI